jgi:hypothetical protein
MSTTDHPNHGAVVDAKLRWHREQLIPLSKEELLRAVLGAELFRGEAWAAFQRWCQLVEAIVHHWYHRRLLQLKTLYAPFDPDSITISAADTKAVESDQVIPRLFDEFSELLGRANYRRLDRHDLELAARAASEWGVRLRVDFRAFERLEVFVCGDVLSQRKRRTWRTGYRTEDVLVPVYQRLVVMARLRQHRWLDRRVDPDAVYIKMFKNIPKEDVDMLLPCCRFRMTVLDRGKILLPTVSGLVLAAVKIIKGAVVLAFAGIYGILILVGGMIGYGIKSFLGYQRTKDRYHLSLTRSLYYQNLDNNAGVLFRVLNEAEEQEFREAVLAYALLFGQAGSTGWTAEELDGAAEQFLQKVLGFPVDFEVSDALAKLQQLGCVERNGESRWCAVRPERACERLSRAWDECF